MDARLRWPGCGQDGDTSAFSELSAQKVQNKNGTTARYGAKKERKTMQQHRQQQQQWANKTVAVANF